MTSLFANGRSLQENIRFLFFDKAGFLYEEPRNLLTQEFSDIAVTNNVLQQIADGAGTVNLISAGCHEKEATVLYHLGKLMDVGLVDRKTCITEEKNRKKVRYVLKDHMFRFWYAYLPRAASAIEIDQGFAYYERNVAPQLHHFMGAVFEDMCRVYCLREGLEERLSCYVTEVGSWWGMETVEGTDGQKRSQSADIDVVGLAAAQKAMVVGECKFRNEKMGKHAFDTLVRRAKAIKTDYEVRQYLLFSLGGYEDYFQQDFQGRILPLTLDDLYDS